MGLHSWYSKEYIVEHLKIGKRHFHLSCCASLSHFMLFSWHLWQSDNNHSSICLDVQSNVNTKMLPNKNISRKCKQCRTWWLFSILSYDLSQIANDFVLLIAKAERNRTCVLVLIFNFLRKRSQNISGAWTATDGRNNNCVLYCNCPWCSGIWNLFFFLQHMVDKLFKLTQVRGKKAGLWQAHTQSGSPAFIKDNNYSFSYSVFCDIAPKAR